MTRFYQIHMLTTYPPSNLNRDDVGRPKTAIVGGTTRLRVSSQSLKRAWRTSEVFAAAVTGAMGTRTKRLGVEVAETMRAAGISENDATAWARDVASVFGSIEKDGLEIEQLVHITPGERAAVDAYVGQLIERKSGPTDAEKTHKRKEGSKVVAYLPFLKHDMGAADVAMFGRMLAGDPKFGVDAAVQVAHAITVHPVTIEDDYFTAVDDLKGSEEDAGAGHVGVHEFASGVFYSYVCVDRDSLVENLQGDEELARKSLAAFIEAMATVSPSGKQNSFASRAYASYMLVEKGDRQPRTLSAAFLDAIRGEAVLAEAVRALEAKVEAFDKAYGALSTDRQKLNVDSGEGSLDDLKKFIQG